MPSIELSSRRYSQVFQKHITMSTGEDRSSSILSPAIEDVDRFQELEESLNTRLVEYEAVSEADDSADFLKAVFRHLPPSGRSSLVNNICECTGDNEIWQLAENIDTTVLQPVLATVGRIPTMIMPSPCVDAKTSIEELASFNFKPATCRQQSQLHTNV